MDLKKQQQPAPGRGSTAKRSRAAEVHNLSERVCLNPMCILGRCFFSPVKNLIDLKMLAGETYVLVARLAAKKRSDQ